MANVCVLGEFRAVQLISLMLVLVVCLHGCGRQPAAQAGPEDSGLSTESATGLPGGQWTAGVHYEVLTPSESTSGRHEKVEVLEFFYFGCPHCYALESSLATWIERRPDYIDFHRVPATWLPVARAHARLFYTLQLLGREDLHQEVFATLHQRHGSLFKQDEKETLRLQLEFAKMHGVNAEDFLSAFGSSTVDSNMQRADELARRYRVASVPTMVVNSRYKATLSQAGGHGNDLIALVSDLAASEHRR